jgi:multiple sugar transport system ATP-binding protein
MTLGDRVAVLRKGVMEQLASPRDLYEQPVNLFVAGFIGSPPMNFLPVSVKGNELHLPFMSCPLRSEIASRVADRKVLIAGIRPEHFEDANLIEDHKKERGVTFDVRVDVTEWLGNQQYAYIPYEAPPEIVSQLESLDKELDGEQLRTQMVVSLDPMSRVRDGEHAKLWLDPTRMHLFDPHTGENLTVRRDGDRAPAGAAGSTTLAGGDGTERSGTEGGSVRAV